MPDNDKKIETDRNDKNFRTDRKITVWWNDEKIETCMNDKKIRTDTKIPAIPLHFFPYFPKFVNSASCTKNNKIFVQLFLCNLYRKKRYQQIFLCILTIAKSTILQEKVRATCTKTLT